MCIEVKPAAEASALEAQSLEQERRRTETLANELAETRRSVNARNLQLRELANELREARREIDTHVAMSNKTADEAAQLKQAAESATAELRRSLQQERDRAEALERDLAHRTADPPIALQTAASSPVAQMAAASPHICCGGAKQSGSCTVDCARQRAAPPGDIGAARIVLERAAETGSAQASFTLAETYDPVILSTWGHMERAAIRRKRASFMQMLMPAAFRKRRTDSTRCGNEGMVNRNRFCAKRERSDGPSSRLLSDGACGAAGMSGQAVA